MGRSDSSDSDYERRRRRKKKERRRSRSASSSDRGSSSRKRSRKSSRDRRRSRSRSHSRDRSRKNRRSRSRSRSRERSRRHRSRSESRERTSRSRHYDDSSSKSKSTKTKHEKGIVVTASSEHSNETNVSLKDKIKALTVKTSDDTPEPVYKPSAEELARIDKDSFVQEHFSKTYNQPNPPQQGKKKKKKKKQQQLQQSTSNQQNIAATNTNTNFTEPKISHDDAIFGTASDTLYLSSKFSSRIDTKRRQELKTKEETNEDLIFGAMFCEKPEVRMKRWLEKLQAIRKRLRESTENT